MTINTATLTRFRVTARQEKAMTFTDYLAQHGLTWRQSAVDMDAHLARHKEWREAYPDCPAQPVSRNWRGMLRIWGYGLLALYMAVGVVVWVGRGVTP